MTLHRIINNSEVPALHQAEIKFVFIYISMSELNVTLHITKFNCNITMKLNFPKC